MFRYIMLMSLVVLGGCATTTDIIKRENVVVKPSEALYKCDTAKLPNPDTLTDRQVAQLIKDLVKNNSECKRSLKAIHAFVETADGIVVNQAAIDKVKGR
jgi:hypothetical protein